MDRLGLWKIVRANYQNQGYRENWRLNDKGKEKVF